MADKEYTRIQLRGDSKENWERNNPILKDREVGVQKGSPLLFKIGDGVTEWVSLPYASGPEGPKGSSGVPARIQVRAIEGETVSVDIEEFSEEDNLYHLLFTIPGLLTDYGTL